MKKISLLLLLCLHIIVGITACKSREPDVTKESDVTTEDARKIFDTKLSHAASLGVSGRDIPRWLSSVITEIEAVHMKDISIVKIRVFQCKWKNRSVYLIRNNLASCVFCEMYDGDGEKIIWPGDVGSNDFCIESENWELIYEFGNSEIY
jgi:hypothetical protein